MKTSLIGDSNASSLRNILYYLQVLIYFVCSIIPLISYAKNAHTLMTKTIRYGNGYANSADLSNGTSVQVYIIVSDLSQNAQNALNAGLTVNLFEQQETCKPLNGASDQRGSLEYVTLKWYTKGDEPAAPVNDVIAQRILLTGLVVAFLLWVCVVYMKVQFTPEVVKKGEKNWLPHVLSVVYAILPFGSVCLMAELALTDWTDGVCLYSLSTIVPADAEYNICYVFMIVPFAVAVIFLLIFLCCNNRSDKRSESILRYFFLFLALYLFVQGIVGLVLLDASKDLAAYMRFVTLGVGLITYLEPLYSTVGMCGLK